MYSYSFRIKKAMAINMQHEEKMNEEKMVIIYKGLICAIDIHRKAIESVHILQYLYNVLY